MKNFFMVVFTVVILFSVLALPLPAAAQEGDNSEPYSGDVLCQPDIYLAEPGDCLAMGPSAFLTNLAKRGIVYPFQPLPATRPDPSLSEVDTRYAQINIEPTEPAAVYASPEDASMSANPVRFIEGGVLRFISYSQRVDINGGHYLLLPGGGWVRASPADYLRFQGLLFRQNPRTTFGWIVEQTKPLSAPDRDATVIDKELPRQLVVQIYDVQKTKDTTWYMIGLNEWVERRYIRQFEMNITPPAGVDNNRWIEVNLYEQTIGVYEDGRLLFATLIASGLDPYFTKPGLFQIQEKKPRETMSGAFAADRSDFYYLADVPWTMYYDGARALHGAYWRAWLGYPQSHGCVNMSVGDARWLYDWAKVGDWVYVWDPSGQTPTDPNFYKESGAY